MLEAVIPALVDPCERVFALETSALAGKNAARLIVDEWQSEKVGKQDGEALKVQGGSEWEYEGIRPKEEQKPLKAKL